MCIRDRGVSYQTLRNWKAADKWEEALNPEIANEIENKIRADAGHLTVEMMGDDENEAVGED